VKNLHAVFLVFLSVLLNGCGGGYSAPPMQQPQAAPLSVSSGAPPSGAVSVAYGPNGSGFTLTASGGTAPYTWSWAAVAGSSLPDGLSLTNGIISGTPTAAGSFKVVVTVSDTPSPVAHITVSNYTIQIVASTLTINSGPLPAGQVGTFYGQSHTVRSARGPITVTFFQLSAGGGATNLSWSWSAAQGSSLPPGLACCRESFGGGIPFGRGVVVNGAIAGVPTVPGNYDVVISVSDNGAPAQQVSAAYTIAIAPPAPPSVNLTPAPPIGTLNSPYVGFSFTATNGLPPLSWSESGPLPPGMVFDATGLLSGTPTAAGTFPISVKVVDAVGQVSPAASFSIQILTQGFAPIASMGTTRAFHTASLLNNGKVVVIGGANSNGELASSELFDPTTKTFTPAGNMVEPRHSHTATVLADGKVIVIGGFNVGNALTTTEIFDATTGNFSSTGSMATARALHTATLLQTGKILVTGGLDATGVPTATAELFDPVAGTFNGTSNMSTVRAYHTATLLSDGKVLVAGGLDSTNSPLVSAELFDPATGKFTQTSTLATPRFQHTATLLNSGSVLIAGGGSLGGEVNSTELFDANHETFSAGPTMATARAAHTATLLANGWVLFAGGVDFNLHQLSAAELFDPVANTISPTANLIAARSEHTTTLLSTGQALVTGGLDSNSNYLATAELYH